MNRGLKSITALAGILAIAPSCAPTPTWDTQTQRYEPKSKLDGHETGAGIVRFLVGGPIGNWFANQIENEGELQRTQVLYDALAEKIREERVRELVSNIGSTTYGETITDSDIRLILEEQPCAIAQYFGVEGEASSLSGTNPLERFSGEWSGGQTTIRGDLNFRSDADIITKTETSCDGKMLISRSRWEKTVPITNAKIKENTTLYVFNNGEDGKYKGFEIVQRGINGVLLREGDVFSQGDCGYMEGTLVCELEGTDMEGRTYTTRTMLRSQQEDLLVRSDIEAPSDKFVKRVLLSRN